MEAFGGSATLLFLAIQNYGIRYLESLIGSMVGVIAVAFVSQMFDAGVDAGALFEGLLLPKINSMGALYIGISLLASLLLFWCGRPSWDPTRPPRDPALGDPTPTRPRPTPARQPPDPNLFLKGA